MFRTRLLAAGIFAAAAACSRGDLTPASTPLASDATVTADVAAAAADGFAEDVDVMVGMDGRIGNTAAGINGMVASLGGWRPGLSGCTFAGGSFTCPDTLRNGLTVSRVITFRDASGSPELTYDSLLTASINVMADISGSRTHGPWTANVNRNRDITISGLAGLETFRTVNGTGNEADSNTRVTRNDSTRSYSIIGSSVITDVVMPVLPNGGSGWPTAGTITRTLTVTVTSGPNAGKTVTKTITITFDGTGAPTASIDGRQFTIDCVNHTAAPKG